jgi:histidyl-tRNA synthetase
LNEKQINFLEEKIKDTTPNNNDILEIIRIFKAYNFTNFKFDPSVIRGLEYYTGPIFEVNLNFEIKNSKDQVIQFGSIGGGGRYDNLVSNFGNLDCPATGISIGLDRLVYALMQKKEFNIKSTKPIVICVFDKDKIEEYIEILKKLRDSNISAEIYPGEGNLKKQMQYANKTGSPAVILYGDNEIKSGKITLRNLKSGEEISIEVENLVNEVKKII